MTARTTTLKGADAGRYYVEANLDYYLDRGEPPGVWRGAGAQALGLDRAIDEDDFLDLMAGVDPRTGELLGSLHTERTTRGFDVTCSAPKSVSILFAFGDVGQRAEVLAAHDAAVGAVVDWIETHAQVRYRVAGQVCTFDGDGIIAALFRQHSSRAIDPQLHTHVVIPNRVLAPDGRWLALDARTIKRDQQTLSRLYHAGLRAELSARLGVRWVEPANGIAEIAEIPAAVLAEFSTRTRQVEARIAEKLDRFQDTMERAPTPQERWRLEREALLDSRPAKTATELPTLDTEWRERLANLGHAPEQLVGTALARTATLLTVDDSIETRVVERALEELTARQSTWRPAELVRELAGAVPTLVAIPAAQLAPWLDDLAGRVIELRHVDLSRPIPDGVPLRRDGRPVTEAAVDRSLTLPSILAEEERLLALLEQRIGMGGADTRVAAADTLEGPQQELAGAMAGDRQLVLAVGPAGTGKTSAIAPAVEHLRSQGRAVFGVAPSATAAEVLATDAGVDADTLDKLLVEHTLTRPPDHRYDLPPGATIILDEAAMVPTPRLAELVDLAGRRGWRLALIGDPLQFSAIGRGGMFGHLVDTFGAIELERVHRFDAPWEADASLRLRRGDTTVIDLYDRHDRLHGGTANRMRTAVVDAWWTATHAGERAALMAPTTAAIVELNLEAQQRRIEAGELDPAAPSLQVGPYRLLPGDRIATRKNDRQLVTDRHLMVKNRDHWTIDTVEHDGTLLVQGRTGSVRLPAVYVAEHVELAYAETSHANQGRTVDRSYLYLDGPIDARGIYVPLTRGRHSNEAFVATTGEETAADVLTEALSRNWIDRPAIAVREDLRRPETVGTTDNDGRDLTRSSQLRELLERRDELDRLIRFGTSGVDDARRWVIRAGHDREAIAERIADLEGRLQRARATIETYDRPLLRRRHAHELTTARNEINWIPRTLEQEGPRLREAEGLEARAVKAFSQAHAVAQRRPELLAEQAIVQHRLADDVLGRGERLAAIAPAFLVEHLGPVPARASELSAWKEAAGQVAQHREAYDYHGSDLLEPEPRGYLEVDAYVSSHQAARGAVTDLNRTLGRLPEREVPQRELGIELSL